jgi:hypothetical protein
MPAPRGSISVAGIDDEIERTPLNDRSIATNHSADSPAVRYASRPTPADRLPDRDFRARLERGDQDEHAHVWTGGG